MTRRIPWWVVLGVAVLGVALLVGPRRSEGPPLDPESTGPLGARALVLLLEELDARVEIARSTPSDHDVALLLEDRVSDHGRRQIEQWVRAGGTLVVADPQSPLNPFRAGSPAAFGPLPTSLRRGCDVKALTAVERVDPAGGLLYEVPAGATGCFRRGARAFLAVAGVGQGAVVAIGGAGAFVNANLGEADNGLLAAALLAPRSGTRVAFLRPSPPGSGSESLTDLVSPAVKQALVQLGVAFALLALWRARRLGRPITEPDLVELDASELVVAVGNLLQQAGRRDHAAARIADDLRRRLGQRLGLGTNAPADQVARVAAARAGMSEERLIAVLAPRRLAGEDALVRLAREAEAVHEEVVHV